MYFQELYYSKLSPYLNLV